MSSFHSSRCFCCVSLTGCRLQAAGGRAGGQAHEAAQMQGFLLILIALQYSREVWRVVPEGWEDKRLVLLSHRFGSVQWRLF